MVTELLFVLYGNSKIHMNILFCSLSLSLSLSLTHTHTHTHSCMHTHIPHHTQTHMHTHMHACLYARTHARALHYKLHVLISHVYCSSITNHHWARYNKIVTETYSYCPFRTSGRFLCEVGPVLTLWLSAIFKLTIMSSDHLAVSQWACLILLLEPHSVRLICDNLMANKHSINILV